jgi:dehydrogenase/reductase SDR family protein 12
MSLLTKTVNGTLFFTGFLPSFTRIGLAARRARWEELAPDFAGQRWLVTGASTGLGREIALAAARAGARVVAVARSSDRLAALATETGSGPGEITPVPADLSLVRETRGLVAELAEAGLPFDVLVNNVGVLFNEPITTPEGLDAGFATNLLNQYVLTEGLRERGLFASEACVVTMSSGGLYNVALSVADLQSHEDYNGSLAYANHKRGQAALTRWWREQDLDGIRYYVMHPGWADTPGVQNSLPEFHKLLGKLLRSPEEGADTALWLAAKRPEQEDSSGIWFDRALRPAHRLLGTRGGDSPADLAAYLEEVSRSIPTDAGAPTAASRRHR